MRAGVGLGLVCLLLVGCSSSDSKSGEPCSDCGGAAGTGTGTSTAMGGSASSSSTGTHSTEASRGGTSSTLPSTGGNPNFFVADPNGQTARSLQISAGTLFWISGMGQIVRALTSGGTAVNIYTQSTGESGTVEIGAIAVDGSDVYFTSCGKQAAARGVYHLVADGSSVPTRLVAGTLPTSIALQGNDLCFEDAGSIRCTKKDGSAATTIATDVYNRQPTLVVKDGYVYFHAAFNHSDPEHVYRARVNDGVLDNAGTAGAAGAPSLGATKAEPISTVPGRAMILLAPTFDDHYLYWGAGDSIYRWSPAGGPASEVSVSAIGTEAMTAPAPHDVLYVTDGFMYWLSVGMMSGSKMFKQAVENGTRTQFMTGGITSVVSDANFLYGIAGKEIRRVSK